MTQSLGKFKLKVASILGGVATGLCLAGVACGAAATATPPLTRPPTPGAPVVAARPTPTVTPAPTTAPAAKVNPGKLTIMVGDLANERFDNVFVGGTPGLKNYSQLVHGFLINSN